MVEAKHQRLLSIQGLWVAQSGRNSFQELNVALGQACPEPLYLSELCEALWRKKSLTYKSQTLKWRGPSYRRDCGSLNSVTITCSLAATCSSSALFLRPRDDSPCAQVWGLVNQALVWRYKACSSLFLGHTSQTLTQWLPEGATGIPFSCRGLAQEATEYLTTCTQHAWMKGRFLWSLIVFE